MSNWKDFEDKCADYLNKTYGDYANFIHHGVNNSRITDIEVVAKNGLHFWMEVKESQAQCGQFVLLPCNGKFVFSEQNKSSENKYTDEIMRYMNQNFNYFMEIDTSGKKIDSLPKEIFYGWILDYYRNKCVEFFITKAEDFIIFPINAFPKYFDVSAKYRVKKSGSSNPSLSDYNEIRGLLGEIDAPIIKKENYVNIKTSLISDKTKLIGNKHSFFFRDNHDGTFRVTKTSNTANANVIFSIKLKEIQEPTDLEIFKDALN